MQGQTPQVKEKPLCRANPSHNASKPSYLCLHGECRYNRLLCQQCLGDMPHKTHKKVFVNAFIEPFSRLACNSNLPNSNELYSTLQKRVHNIKNVLNKEERQIAFVFQSIRSKLLYPIETIAGTFSKQMVQFAVHTIEEAGSNNQEEIERIAGKLNFLLGIDQKEYIQNFEKVDIIEKTSLKIIAEVTNKIKAALETMESEVNILQGLERQKLSRFEHNKLQIERELQQSIHKYKKEDLETLQKLERSLSAELKAPLKAKEATLKAEIQENQEVLDSAKRRMRLTKPQAKKEKPALSDSRRRGRKAATKLTKKDSDISVEESELKLQTYQQQQHYQHIGERQIQGEQQRQGESSSLVVEKDETKKLRWTVSANRPIGEITQSMLRNIYSLQIQNLVCSPDELFDLLKQLVNLREISIFDSVICEANNILALMDALPKSIRKINFNCTNQFFRNCIQSLWNKNLRSFTRIQYLYDIQHLLRRLDQSFYFTVEKGVRIQPMNLSETFFMFSCFPMLTNAWIKVQNFSKSRRKNTIKFSRLECLTIGELQEMNIEKIPLPPQLYSHMMETRFLKCLVLMSIIMETEHFINVVTNNPNLQTLYLEQCQGPSEQSMERITKDSKIKNFSIKDCTEITGSFIQKVAKAQIFIMDYSDGPKSMIPPNPFTGFQECNSLIYLNLYGNSYVYDYLLSTLKNSFSTLRSMNIGFTQITDVCVEYLKQIPEIECLCLDDNLLTSEGIYKICSHLKKILKLSLCGYNGERGKGEMSTELLNRMGRCLPELKHLSIKNCCRMGEDLDLKEFPSLKTVELDANVNPDFITTLKCAGIKIFDDNDFSDI